MKRKANQLQMTAVLAAVVCLLFAAAQTANAKSVSPQKAAQIAKRFINAKQCGMRSTSQHSTPYNTLVHLRQVHPLSGDSPTSQHLNTSPSQHLTTSPYYLFNAADGRGFVIVAGNDEMGEVLAYSTEHTLDTLNANPCVKLLLEGYKQGYQALQQGKAVAKAPARAGLFTKTVEPLLKSKWGQSEPYNELCGYPYTGCVATAMAQIMYYHRWPAQGIGENGYKVAAYDDDVYVDFSQSHYDWANMLDDYRYPVQATKEQKAAVALLMRDFGVASFMQYTPALSGTQGVNAYNALRQHFDYTSAYVTKAMEGATRFAEILREELLSGCPVYLEGRPAGSSSGHAWVTDGFDENGLFHMNFGWDGGGDAYFSLTNLSLQETGDEFGNKPLAFNRALTAILAHPNNGKYPAIDPGLMENQPQLMFNESGVFRMSGADDKVFDAKQTQTVEMSSFVNKGKEFKGDVGVAVYDAEGNLKSITYSDDHAGGGFTQRLFGDYGGSMGTDNLMIHTLRTKVSFDGLADGYYRLVPVCAAMGEDGTWGDFLRMKKAPTIEVELTGGKGRISETCSAEDVVFQLMNQPRLSANAEQGESVYAYFNVKNLNGVPRDCYLRVQLLDEAKQVVLNTRVDQVTEIEGFTETEIPVKLDVPADLAPARYEVKLEVTRDKEETDFYPINNIHDKDVAYIEVVKAEEKPLMAKVEVFFSDNSDEKVESGSIDMAQTALFKIGVLLRTNEKLTYNGNAKMVCEDVESGEKFEVNGLNDEVSLSSAFDIPLYSYWLRKSSVPFEDGHIYKVVMIGEKNGEEMELKVADAPDTYIKREGDVLTLTHDVPTGIGSAASTAAPVSVKREGSQIVVSGEGIKSASLYTISGELVTTSTPYNTLVHLRQVHPLRGELVNTSARLLPLARARTSLHLNTSTLTPACTCCA